MVISFDTILMNCQFVIGYWLIFKLVNSFLSLPAVNPVASLKDKGRKVRATKRNLLLNGKVSARWRITESATENNYHFSLKNGKGENVR